MWRLTLRSGRAGQLSGVRCGVGGLRCVVGAAEPAGKSPAAGVPLDLSDGLTLADFIPEKKAGGANGLKAPVVRKPPWLKMYNPNLTVEGAEKYKTLKSTVKDLGLATVCQEAKCPNIGECWSSGTATVMIMGDTCTRGCRFCSVATSKAPPPPDPLEPENMAEAVRKWGLNYVVLTMVDRDDLADQGAAHVAATVRQLKGKSSGSLRVETLCGDFQGRLPLVEEVVRSGMDVFAHNVETVERLQRTVRDRRAGYRQSLAVLRHAKEVRPEVVTKSSLMLGLGESVEEVQQALRDMREAGVEVLTLGQYLQPTKRHMKVARYVEPAEFDELRVFGESLGFAVASGPLVRSSYKADELFTERLARRASGSVAA